MTGGQAAEERGLEDLLEWLRIPSVSADPAHEDDVVRAADWVAAYVKRLGGTVELTGPASHPLVVGDVPASRGAARDAPTVMLYGHYDVQPAGDLAAWRSPPFEPQLDGEWLYCRGAADDKSNFFVLLRAVDELAAAGELPVRVKILADGEEEVIGTSVVDHVLHDTEPPDACVIFDGPMLQRDRPLLVIGTRGLLYLHVRVRTGAQEMHSGFVGGAALNAGRAIVEMLAVAWPPLMELADSAVEPSAAERAAWAELPDPAGLLEAYGARPADRDAAGAFYARTLGGFAVDVNGIRCGEADLQKTVIPADGAVNLSMRLLPGQDPESLRTDAEAILRASAPPGTDVEIECWASTPASAMRAGTQVVEAGREAFRDIFGTLPPVVRTGGTVPIMAALADRGIPTIMTGLDLLDGNAHAPNERFRLDYIPKGIDTAKAILSRLGSLGTVGGG
jgi:acetylornithine deacetylase/succinyl-diaminopimelate desuccinylase-like protein